MLLVRLPYTHLYTVLFLFFYKDLAVQVIIVCGFVVTTRTFVVQVIGPKTLDCRVRVPLWFRGEVPIPAKVPTAPECHLWCPAQP